MASNCFTALDTLATMYGSKIITSCAAGEDTSTTVVVVGDSILKTNYASETKSRYVEAAEVQATVFFGKENLLLACCPGAQLLRLVEIAKVVTTILAPRHLVLAWSGLFFGFCVNRHCNF